MPRQLPGDIHRFINRTAELGELNAVLPTAQQHRTQALRLLAPHEAPLAAAVRGRLGGAGRGRSLPKRATFL
ncbi:hypothetical protein ACFXKG_26415 [Streptomyces sp. NPDC059255]|uniref:hypothetical protein n=1 Tax=Streptomyces sp. NPDC059255 TaxID=3346793 RepID=UPI003680C508